MQISIGVEARLKQEEMNKETIGYNKIRIIRGSKIDQFSGIEDNKYLNYYIWQTEFSELGLNNEYLDSVKLKFLKQYTERDAHQLVKNRHHPQESYIAFRTLDEHYGKPTMVIKESMRILRIMETVNILNEVKTNRALYNKINKDI